MTQIVDPQSGLYRDVSDLAFVESLIKSKNEKSRWETIDLVIGWYAKKYLTDKDPYTGMTYGEYIDSNKRTRDSLYNKKTGTGRENIGRFILSVPQKIIYLIGKLYPDIIKEGMTGQRKYYREFANRYTQFKLPEKV